jgi:hypothetical protein
MKKSTKILLAIATIWPFLYMIFFFVFMFSMFSSMSLKSPPEVGAFNNFFTVIIPLHVLTILLIVGLTIFYIVNVFRNDRVAQDKKALWAVVLFLGNVIAFPVYWYFYIWPEGKALSKTAPPQALPDAAAFTPAKDATNSEGRAEYVSPPQPPDWR